MFNSFDILLIVVEPFEIAINRITSLQWQYYFKFETKSESAWASNLNLNSLIVLMKQHFFSSPNTINAKSQNWRYDLARRNEFTFFGSCVSGVLSMIMNQRKNSAFIAAKHRHSTSLFLFHSEQTQDSNFQSQLAHF